MIKEVCNFIHSISADRIARPIYIGPNSENALFKRK